MCVITSQTKIISFHPPAGIFDFMTMRPNNVLVVLLPSVPRLMSTVDCCRLARRGILTTKRVGIKKCMTYGVVVLALIVCVHDFKCLYDPTIQKEGFLESQKEVI